VEFNQKESMQEIILNPRKWAEKIAEGSILDNLDKYKKAKELGEFFAKEITNVKD